MSVMIETDRDRMRFLEKAVTLGFGYAHDQGWGRDGVWVYYTMDSITVMWFLNGVVNTTAIEHETYYNLTSEMVQTFIDRVKRDNKKLDDLKREMGVIKPSLALAALEILGESDDRYEE